jgi:hypothetical protein
MVHELGAPARRSGPESSGRTTPAPHLAGMPLSVVVLMGLVAAGVGRFVNPLLLAYMVAFGYVVVGVLQGREPVAAEVEESEAPEEANQEEEDVAVEDRPEEPDRTSG